MRIDCNGATSNEKFGVCKRTAPTQQLAQALHLKAARLEPSPG